MFEIEDFAECGAGGELLFPGTLVVLHGGTIICGDCAHTLDIKIDLMYH
jgi:hypothetical protein